MNRIKNILLVLGLFSLTFVSCEDKIDPIVEELQFERVFTPLNLTARIRNMITVELSWSIKEDASSYVVEVSEDSLEFTNIIKTVTVAPDELPVSILLEGETRYSARVKGTSDTGLDESKWATVVFKTDPENIFNALGGDKIGKTEVTLSWPAGSEVTHFIISANGTNAVRRDITETEAAAGEATITGLTFDTRYTVIMYNEPNPKQRGKIEFTTLPEGETLTPDMDLVEAINTTFASQDVFLLESGEYTIPTGTFILNRPIKIKGLNPDNKPIIYGQLSCGTTIASIELKDLIFRGNADAASLLGQFFNTTGGCNLTTLTIDGCEISNYGNNFIYNNTSGTYGTISIKNSYIHDIPGSGGDGIDFRGGSITALTVENSTFANGFRNFLRMQVACAVSFKNCTFYKVSTVDNSNNNGLFRMNKTAGGSFEVRNCLFVETGVESPASAQVGNFCRQDSYMVELPVYANNNIFACHNLLVGLYTTLSQISATELNPGFVDAANGNFKITNQTLIDNAIGDQRWK